MSWEQSRFVFLVGTFGVLGVLARLGVISLTAPRSPHFPLGTLVVNLLGSFLIGMLYSIGTSRNLISMETSSALAIGFLGGFTTLSSLSLESMAMIQNGRLVLASVYLIGTPVAGLVCAFLGFGLAQRI